MKQQSLQEQINKCFYDQSITLIQSVYEKSEKEELDMEDFLEEFKKVWEVTNKITQNKPEKQKRKTKELTDDERCIANKKDTTRCAGKKYLNGENPSLCSLHNNKGAKYGTIDDSNTTKNNSDITQKEEEIQNNISNSKQNKTKSIRCTHLFTKGNRKGETCNNIKMKNKEHCKLHLPKETIDDILPLNNDDNENELFRESDNENELFGEVSDNENELFGEVSDDEEYSEEFN